MSNQYQALIILAFHKPVHFAGFQMRHQKFSLQIIWTWYPPSWYAEFDNGLRTLGACLHDHSLKLSCVSGKVVQEKTNGWANLVHLLWIPGASSWKLILSLFIVITSHEQIFLS